MNTGRLTVPRASEESALASGIARLGVGAVFAVNVWCAIAFLVQPGLYAPGFELTGLQGNVVVRAFGILFLMWSATYPAVLVNPRRSMVLFAVVLAQQTIGLVGETWLWMTLPTGHPAAAATLTRFMVFDGVGLAVMAVGFVMLASTRCSHQRWNGRPL